MSDNVAFNLRFPRIIQFDDEIVIKGKLKDPARVFSVNLCVDNASAKEQPLVAFHFRTHFYDDETSKVFLGYRREENKWGPEIEMENYWIDDRVEPFVLTLKFKESALKVYSEEDGSNYQFEFPYKTDLRYISSLQLWDDLDGLDEVTLRFSNKS